MFHRQSSNSIKQLMWLQICYMYLHVHASFRMKDTPRQKMVGLPPFPWDITKLKSIRKINHGRCTHESYDSVRSLNFSSSKR